MKTHTTVRSWPAIGLGAFFAAVTAYVLFEDVAHGAAITTGHVLALGALVAAIASGHMAWPAIRSGAVIPGLLLPVLFLAATGYVVVSSGARNAELAGNKAAAITAANETRARVAGQLARAEAMLAEASGILSKECASGAGPRCRGARATVEVYEAAIKGHHAALAALPAPKLANGYAHTARVLASWGLAVTDEWLSLNMPFAIVLIAEVGTIAFLHLGLGHCRTPRTHAPGAEARLPCGQLKGHGETAPEGASKDVASIPDESPEPPRGPGKRGRKSDPNVLSFNRAFREKHGRAPSGSDIRAAFPDMPKSTAYDYAKRA